MIISKTVTMKVTNTNKKNLQSKGYNTNDEVVLVNIKDLKKGSHIRIEAKCINCGSVTTPEYRNYLKQTNDNTTQYYCSKCKNVKIKKTTKDRYGEDSIFKIKEYQDKIDNIMIEKYGVKDALSNIDILDSMKKNITNKYGVDNISKLKTIKEKKIKTLSSTWIDRLNENNPNINIKNGDYNKQILICDCDQGKNHTFEITYSLFHNRKLFKSIICTKCHKIGRNINSIEKRFYNFISDNYDGEILRNDRKVIKPYEFDIYLPELKIAFEFNGFKWHSFDKLGKNYHKMKTDLAINKGVQLIHFYQDDWMFKDDIVKSMILNKIKKTPRKIYARKCVIKKIDNSSYENFCIVNHIQGYVSCKLKYGLFHDNILVGIMSIGRRKISGQNINELLRYCTLLNTNVIGGFSKILKYIINENDITELITYANKSYSNGILYEKNNFTYLSDTKPNYFYIINNKRKHRYMYRKDVLVKQGYDKDKTEREIMSDRGILSIYDSGSKKYKLTI